MSCGRLHEAAHEHAHDHDDHEEDRPGAVEAAEPAGELETPAEPGWLGRLAGGTRAAASAAWDRHGYLIRPFAWVPATEGSEWIIHQAYGGDWVHALAAAAAAAAVGEGASEIVNHRNRAVRPVRKKSRIAAGTSAALMAAGGAGTPAGWENLMVWATLVFAAATAGMVAHEAHKAHVDRPPVIEDAAPEPAAIEAPAEPDPRLTQFTEMFCGPGGPLDGVGAGGFREAANGFMFELDFTRTAHSPEDVTKLEVAIAKLYDIRRAAVTVDYIPGNDSENYCQVLIRKAPLVTAEEHAKPKVRLWDGKPTWNPETGCADLGWFADEAVTHYRFNIPRSGSSLGMVAGVMGSGKTGTIHVLGCEAGLAKLCRACGHAGTCEQCQLERVMAVWMASAQEQSMSVWKGRADLTGLGPEGCVELLEFTDQVSAARGKFLSARQWWDTDPVTGHRRHNTGQGHFDPEVGLPLIFLVMDEFPILMRHPDKELRDTAKRIALNAVTEWRKRGIHLLIGTATLDATLIGIREIRELIKFFNSIAHRADETTSNLGGITGDPRKLSAGLPGAGYISGFDARPGSEFATKFARETALHGEGGVDIRHLAGIIGNTPLLYDQAVLGVMEQWKIPHQHVFENWYGRPQGGDGASAPFTAPAAAPTVIPVAGPSMPLPGAPVPYREDAEKILAYLRGNPGAHSYGELLKETGLSLGAIRAVALALKGNGQATGPDKHLQAA